MSVFIYILFLGLFLLKTQFRIKQTRATHWRAFGFLLPAFSDVSFRSTDGCDHRNGNQPASHEIKITASYLSQVFASVKKKKEPF